ncbi:MAG: type II toxin-antitoxin system RelE/ParE family toxin [bacterium]
MRKKYNIVIAKAAEDDLDGIWNYISVDSIKNATNFITEIEERIYSLENYPLRNPLIPENEILGSKYRHLIYKDYRIIYRIKNYSVYILRILHGSRLFEKDVIEESI